MRLLSILAAGLCLGVSTSWAADHWPQWRGPSGDGVAEAKHPEQWSADEHIAWKVEVPGVGWSQPIVWDGKVFLTTCLADQRRPPRPGDWTPGNLSAIFGSYKRPPNIECEWKVLCLDAATGKTIWEQTPHTGKPRISIHANNSYATETCATDGERLIAYFGMTGIYCYDLAGQLQWTKDLGSYPTQMDWGTGSSPVMHEELVFIQCDNNKDSFLVALDKKTGDESWRVERDELSNWATPIIWKNSQRTELVAGGGTKMRSYDPASGKLLWEMAASGRCSPSPVAAGDLLFVGSADRLTGQRGIVAAIKPGASGDISLEGDSTTNEFVLWSSKLSGHRVASPVVSADCLFCSSSRPESFAAWMPKPGMSTIASA